MGTMPELPKQVSAVGAIGDSIDGHAPTANTGRTREKKGTATYLGWQCPKCKQEFPDEDKVRHLFTHINSLEDQVARTGSLSSRFKTDELGHHLFYPPTPDGYPVVWLTFGELMVDPTRQRGRRGNHELLRPGVQLDHRLTEALTVAPVYGPRKGGGEPVLIGYRLVEGQHRTLLGIEQCPEDGEWCKIIIGDLTPEQESRMALLIQATRSAFRWVDIWDGMLRSKQPNVVAAAAWMSREENGYLVTGDYTPKGIAAVAVLFKIVGVMGADKPAPTVVKEPLAGVGDLADVLAVAEGMKAAEGDQSRRYSAVILGTIYKIIEDNREIIEVDRFARQLGTKTVRQWTLLNDPTLGGTTYLRAQMVNAYNKGKKSQRIV